MKDERPRITFSSYDSFNNPYYGGGGALATHNIARRLTKNYAVRIVCSTYPAVEDRTIDSVRYEHIGSFTKNHKVAQLFFAIALILEVRKRHKYDLWFENFTPPYSTNFLPYFTKKPVVGIASLLHAEKFSEKYKLPFYILENKGLKAYKHIILLNSEFYKKIKKINKKAKIYVIPRGIEKSYLTEPSIETNLVLYLGRIDIFQKGIDILIDAWSLVCLKYPKIRLVIAGGGPNDEVSKVKELIRTKKLKKFIYMVGKVKGNRKIKLLRECMFGVVPSRFESFGNSALELMAFGKSVINFDIGGMEWIPGNLSVKVEPFDKDKLAKAIIYLLGNKNKRENMGKKARKFASDFEWSKIVDQYETLIKKLL